MVGAGLGLIKVFASPRLFTKMNTLIQLHDDIEARVRTIRDGNADWLCRMGCDGCCRRLAEIPRLTAAEWDLLKDGLAALSPELRQDIGRNIVALAEQSSRPIECPMLNRSAGACTVYAYRPVACRTYGFYVQRDKGLYCKDIEAQVADGELSGVVWGNHDAVDHRLRAMGDSRDLTEWFALWQQAGDGI
jgi:Fe-S-cluster containining protein